MIALENMWASSRSSWEELMMLRGGTRSSVRGSQTLLPVEAEEEELPPPSVLLLLLSVAEGCEAAA